ncbi:hypothetical protein FOZ62_004837, partial [Perkinsus olseni]
DGENMTVFEHSEVVGTATENDISFGLIAGAEGRPFASLGLAPPYARMKPYAPLMQQLMDRSKHSFMGNICDSCRGSTSKAVPAAAANRQAVRPASTTTSGEVDTAQYAKDIRAMADELTAMIDRLNCDPIIVRFAWHDSGTYDKSLPWPKCGGASHPVGFGVCLEAL